jgi:hypothetical protein
VLRTAPGRLARRLLLLFRAHLLLQLAVLRRRPALPTTLVTPVLPLPTAEQWWRARWGVHVRRKGCCRLAGVPALRLSVRRTHARTQLCRGARLQCARRDADGGAL